MNLLRQAANLLQDKMEQLASEPVIYIRRSTGERTKCIAIIGQTVGEDNSTPEYTTRAVTRDFTIRRALLDNVPPLRHDQIEYEGDLYTIAAEGGRSHFEESDGYGVAWRIHTKRVSTANQVHQQ